MYTYKSEPQNLAFDYCVAFFCLVCTSLIFLIKFYIPQGQSL